MIQPARPHTIALIPCLWLKLNYSSEKCPTWIQDEANVHLAPDRDLTSLAYRIPWSNSAVELASQTDLPAADTACPPLRHSPARAYTRLPRMYSSHSHWPPHRTHTHSQVAHTEARAAAPACCPSRRACRRRVGRCRRAGERRPGSGASHIDGGVWRSSRRSSLS